ncbi:MAG: Type IV leader peptidase family protein [Firmicutes bacterium ADurb.Bin419]|nr:MAG: Type IV leader peptidase family protein [Firmicutes bacterium ADurb.Bin419]
MWAAIAVPMTIILIALANCYLQKDSIFSRQTLKDRIAAFIPAKPLYIAFLAIVFIMGITSFGAQYHFFSSYVKAAKLTTLLMLLAPAAYIDFKSKKIPNELILFGLCTRVVFYVIEMFTNNRTILNIFASDIKGVLLGGGVFLLAALIVRNSIGMGDVKMYALIGLFCGYTGTLASMLFSLFVCFIASVGLLILRKKGRKDTLPLAPFVFIGTYLVIVLGSY